MTTGLQRALLFAMLVLQSSIAEGATLETGPSYPMIQRAFLQEEFERVRALAQTFITEHPAVPEAGRVRLWLALSLERLQQTGTALEELDVLKTQLRSDDPLWPEALYWEGEISRRALQMLRAKSAYRQVLERGAASTWAPKAELGLGLVLLHQQAFQEARDHFHQTASVEPPSSLTLDARLLEGFCALRMGRHGEAVATLEPLIGQYRAPSEIAETAFYLGEALSGQERYDEALRAYQHAAASGAATPWSRAAQLNMGWVLAKLDRCEDSVQMLNRYLASREAEHRAEALFVQAGCLMRMNQEPEALSRLQEIVGQGSNQPLTVESGLLLIDAYRRQDRPDMAETVARALLDRPLEAALRDQVQLQLGVVVLERSDPLAATALFEPLLRSETISTRQGALIALGDVEVSRGNLDGAKARYEEAVSAAEDSTLGARALYQIGRIQSRAGAWEDAVDTFQRVLGTADEALADEARLELAMGHLNRNELEASRHLLRTIRGRQPDRPVGARAAYYEALLALEADDAMSAMQLCRETIERAPREDEALDARLLLAELQERLGSVPDARVPLRSAYDSERLPVSHRARLAKRLGDLAAAKRAYPEAIRWYEAAQRLLPLLDGEMTYRIASCYEEGGDTALALRWYRRADHGPWRIRGGLATARLLEREGRLAEAEATYLKLSGEPVPEAKTARERLARMEADRHAGERERRE